MGFANWQALKSKKPFGLLAAIVGIFRLVGAAAFGANAEIVCAELLRCEDSPAELKRAELHVVKLVEHPAAVLVICPGCNGSGKGLVEELKWQEFARMHNLALIGLSYASEPNALQSGRGYYYVSQGSGDCLLSALRKHFGRDLPLLLFGFSGGAHFASRFVEWKPERVLAWCAYSAGWWDAPKHSQVMPPGIVACGDADPERYGASLMYFKQGRAMGKPWTWVSLSRVGHSRSGALDRFVANYFDIILSAHLQKREVGAQWWDIDTKKEISATLASERPSLSTFLPGAKLAAQWITLHQP